MIELTQINQITFTVVDTGVGIQKAALSRIFEAFTQADSSTTRSFGGTGLGLTIASHLVDKMGGQIWVKSLPNIGSAFSFSITFEQPSNEEIYSLLLESIEPEKHGKQDTHQLSILVAEDNNVNQKLILKLLQKEGHNVTIVENGEKAVEKYFSQKFDIVFMDIQMPVMGGFEATQAIRQRDRTVPIVALTAHALKGDREKCLENGMTDYLSKPIKRQELLNILSTQGNVSSTTK